jgi:genome maintenance exonuclease 1
MKTFNHVTGLPDLKPLSVEEIHGKRYYISPSGKKLPSVTTVLGHFKKKQISEWRARVGDEQANRISTRAATRGTKFHNMMEKYLLNDNTLFEDIMPDMKQAFHDVKDAIDKIDNIHYIEGQMFSERLGLAGRTDCIGEYDGVLSIIDFKTSLKPKKKEWIENYFEQGTAYAMMYEELVGNPIDNIVIIVSTDDGSQPLQIFQENKYDYMQSLLEKIHIYKQETK